jgi:hypothetical protein
MATPSHTPMEVDEGNPTTILLSTLPPPDWDYKSCLSKLLSLPLCQGQEASDKEERLFRLNTKVSLDNRLMVRAVGGLIAYLFKNRAGGLMLDADGGAGIFVSDLNVLRHSGPKFVNFVI